MHTFLETVSYNAFLFSVVRFSILNSGNHVFCRHCVLVILTDMQRVVLNLTHVYIETVELFQNRKSYMWVAT